jgi:predicted dinucleotide-binding enzyme
MKIGVLGTGMVGSTIATRLAQLGHEVKMGARTATSEKAAAWVRQAGARASHGTFAEAAAFGGVVFNCTNGAAALEALQAAGAGNLEGKPLLDVSNPLDFSKGMPPRLLYCNDDSLGERIQRAFPGAKVVKTLNTVNAELMVDPARLPGQHEVFVGGNDAPAKAQAVELLRSFGWKRVIDLGDITSARGTEMWLPLWLRLYGALGTANFNLHLAT